MAPNNSKAAVFILLGQSNAVGHGLPMKDEDRITVPLKNVFGLDRAHNQSYDNDTLYFSGYTSGGMNLGEEQDDTYSMANCLAKQWQAEIDAGNKLSLPDLYIVHIAIGAQGVTGEYMWNPDREKKLIPGKLGTADISLYSFTRHILSHLKESIKNQGKTPEIIGLHWRGGENDMLAPDEQLGESLKNTYRTIFRGFNEAYGESIPTVLHKIVCHERCTDLDPTGRALKNMHFINEVFDELCAEFESMTVFDVRRAPQYIPDVRCNGIFKSDAVHFTPEVNYWAAEEVIKNYSNNRS